MMEMLQEYHNLTRARRQARKLNMIQFKRVGQDRPQAQEYLGGAVLTQTRQNSGPGCECDD